jgi:hypothetical protein
MAQVSGIFVYFLLGSLLGKSNLMEAICFVLGEKTGHLRVRKLGVSFCKDLVNRIKDIFSKIV